MKYKTALVSKSVTEMAFIVRKRYFSKMKLYSLNGWNYLNFIKDNQFKRNMIQERKSEQESFQQYIDANKYLITNSMPSKKLLPLNQTWMLVT